MFQRSMRAGAVAVMALAGMMAASQPVKADSISVGNADPNNWPEYHRTSNAWRYSPLDQVNKTNVKKLHVAWIHQSGFTANGLQATPIVVDGVMYYSAPDNNVYAVDAATGKQIWHYQPKLDSVVNEVFYVSANRGVTVGLGNVYLGTLDGRWVAIDQKTGQEKWSTQLTDPRKCTGCLFSSSPILAGKVLVGGHLGGDQPVPGRIFGVDAETGKLLWTFNNVKDDPKSWPGDTGKVGGGDSWLPGTYDAESDTVFIGVGNAAPDFYAEERAGDNLYTASLLALDPKTGKLKWYRQEIPNDQYDYDSAYEALIVDKDGREMIVHLNKSGFVFVMDKKDGKLENVWPLSETYNFVKTIDPKTGELIGRKKIEVGKESTICPDLFGTRSWNHGAYNPKSGLWYTNAMEVCNKVIPAKQDASKLGIAGLYLGMDKLEVVPPPNQPASARLDARDPITGKLKWTVNYAMPGLGSVLTTGGGLVFNGDAVGIVHAYDADNGKELWNFNVGSGIRSGIVSYAVAGKQYIAVPAGQGSFAPGFLSPAFPGLKDLSGGDAVVVFSLD